MEASLYAQYLREREPGRDIIEIPQGFLSYVISGKECFISDVFVIPKVRGKRYFSFLLARVEEEAKKAGCTLLTGNIWTSVGNPTATLLRAAKLGFQVASANGGAILMTKKLEE